MTQGEMSKDFIFRKYSRNLELLKVKNFLPDIHPKYVGTYICPICLGHFSPKDIIVKKENHLTLEDVPPKALGGKAKILTCWNCNNFCGTKIDSHLSKRLKEIDSKSFLPNSESTVQIEKDGKVFQGKILIDSEGKKVVEHDIRHNNPSEFEEFIQSLKPGDFVVPKFKESKVIPEYVSYALLKTGYLMAFEWLGYSILLDEVYDSVRNQLLNPDDKYYPSNFWFMPPYPKEFCGVYSIMDEGCESLLVLFPLKTEVTERIFGTILPLPIRPIEESLEGIDKLFEKSKQIQLLLYPHSQKLDDYLADLGSITALISWIEKRKNSALTK